ncbi:MAG: MHYT domain-containing protein [Thalassovita sp.]|nr:MHYT domain-containing protein [Thalassovita sp.]
MHLFAYPHSPWLIIASLCVALIAGFTGLSLTQGISKKSVNQRKVAVALAAVSLGGGIWSMHFVAMLGLQLPFLFYYDAAITLASALVAILVVGIALLILHFFKRTVLTLTAAGIIVGLGVLAMHYIGMAGLEMCRALYTPGGIVFAIVGSCALNVAAFWIAYGSRSHRNILLGTVCFGLAVFIVHFVAVASTDFIAIETLNEVGPLISNETLAVGVVISSFLLCGAFLLSGVTFLSPSPAMRRRWRRRHGSPRSPMNRVAARCSSIRPGWPRSGPRAITPSFTPRMANSSAPGRSPRRKSG